MKSQAVCAVCCPIVWPLNREKNIFPVETLEMATRRKIDEEDAQGRPMRSGMRKDDSG